MTTQQLSHFELVGEFHYVFGHPLRSKPYIQCFDDEKLINLRKALIVEEYDEFKAAFETHNVCEMVDALADLIYVVNGCGHALGINLDFMLWLSGMDVSTSIDEVEHVTVENLLPLTTFIQTNSEFINQHIQMLGLYFENKNLQKAAQQLVQILYYAYKLGHGIGFNMDVIFREVHRANMNKTCPTVEDAQASVEFYIKDGRYKNPTFKQKNSYYVVYSGDGKILKNHKWTPPDIAKYV